MAKKTSGKRFDIKQIDKKNIVVYDIVASCACGATFKVKSTKKELRVDICSNCHPFFTGKKRFLDTEGRVEKFNKKYNKVNS